MWKVTSNNPLLSNMQHYLQESTACVGTKRRASSMKKVQSGQILGRLRFSSPNYACLCTSHPQQDLIKNDVWQPWHSIIDNTKNARKRMDYIVALGKKLFEDETR